MKIGLVVVLWEKCCTVGEKKTTKLYYRVSGQGSCLERLWNWFDGFGNEVEEGLCGISA